MATEKKFPEPQVAEKDARPPIMLVQVKSNQVAAIGYDSASQTLAVQFTRGTGAFYHYPGVKPDMHKAFMEAESIGTFFGKHIKPLPFKKYAAEPAPGGDKAEAEKAAA